MLRHARQSGWRITHVHRRGLKGPAARPIGGLEPRAGEPLVRRSGASAFSNRVLRRSVQNDRLELVILGPALSAACLATALTAHDWKLTVTLLEDVSNPTPIDSLEVADLRTVASTLAAPFIKIARTDSLIGARPYLQLVSMT